MSIAITADIIGSRGLADRAAAQRALESTIAASHADLPIATRPFIATVGDELQAVYPDLGGALAAILLLRLALPDGIDCRFGVGIGAIDDVPSAGGALSEGPGWWAAREAIDALHAAQVRRMPGVRTWVASADPDDDARVRLANAYAWARDELVTAMSDRTRRLVRGRCLGRTQRELASDENITQSAVSQALATAGGSAIVEGYRALIA